MSRRDLSRPPVGGRLFARLVAALLVALAAGLISQPALAHGGDDEAPVEAVLDTLPAELAGLRVQLRRTLAPQLLVANPSDKTLTVLDDNDRAFLRIGGDEVQADLGAAAFHRTNTLMAPGAIAADASHAPNWQQVEPASNWGWFDLRLRTDTVTVPHAVKDAGKRARVGDWSIPVVYGDQRSAITGHFEFAPAPGGIPEARVVDSGAVGDKALVRAMNGSARTGLFVSYRGSEPLIVYGAADEPLFRFDAKGTAVNRHSPTWQRIAPPGKPGHIAGDGTRWARLSAQKSYGWVDPRAGYTGTVEAADETSVIKRWTIPVTIGGTESAIEGVTEWKPVKPLAKAD
jgi:hypothetical protein